MIEVKIDGVVKWQVNEYTVVDPQMGIRSISLTVTHPSDNATVPSFVGAYVEYEGERYDIVNSKPTAEKGIDSINYKYNLIFNGQEAELQKRKIRNLAEVGVDAFISQGTSFSLYADINQFKQLLENNLKYYFGNRWTVNLGSTTSESVMVSVNNMFIWDLLLKTFEYYGLRWNITGNTINIGYTPDVIQHVFDYGYSGGLVKITRTAQSEPTINRLIGVGGSRNVPINYFTNRYSDFPVDPNPISGDVNIKNIMPKVFRDSVIAGTLPYTDYVEDAALVASEGVKEDALEPNEEIYPSIAGVEVTGLGRIDQIIAASVPTANTPDDAGYSPTFDIWVKDIGFDLADNQYTATQDAKISFTSGMLAGYEFVILATNGVRNVVVDTSKSYGGVASKYKITLINSSEDFTATGRMLPNSVIKAMAGDSFVIYDIIMPQTYVELAELRVQNWLNEQLLVKKVEKPTYAIEPTDTFFEENIAPESDGKTISEKLKSGNKLTVNNTKVTDGAQELHINNITIQYGGLLPKYSFVVTDKVSVQGSAIARLTNEIQKTDNSVQDTDKKIVKLQQYSDRQWKEIQETITLLGAAIDGFSTGINPITVQTMQLLLGNESLQFRFVSSKTTPVAVSHAFNWDDVLKSFTTTSGIIQHMTLGITEISSNHPVSAYKFWDIASYSNNTLVAEKPYYLYAKCSRTTSGAVFLLSDVPIGMYDDVNYYYFLTGILNSEDSNGGRSFVSLYGFTEILPGRITTDKIVSSDGLTYFDLLNGVIVGKIRFASTGGGETSLAEWADGTSQDIQDAQSAANTANNNFDNLNQAVITELAGINNRFTSLQSQIDGEVSNWFYPYSPTLANYPASDWTTNAIKDRHVGDTFTNTAQDPATDAGKSWRFVVNAGVYSWTQIADSDAVLALQKAAEAKATADGKSTTYLVQPTKYFLGDTWVLAADQTVNGIAYKSGEILTATQDSTTYNQTHWVKKVRYTDDTAVNNMQIGTRNFYHSNTITENYDVALYEKTERGFKGVGNLEGNFPNATIRIRPITDNGDWTLKFKAKSNANGAMRCDMCDLEINTFNLTTEWQTFEFTQNVINYSNIYNYIDFVLPNYAWYYIDDIVVVQGNKAPASFIEAPEDVQARIDAAKQEALDAAGNAQTSANNANTAVGDLNTYVDGSFKDGVIEASEAKAIEKYINIVNTEKSNIEATYNTLYANAYLEGTPKSDLLNAKVTYFGAVDALLASINTAISDGKTTVAEKAGVDSKYATYKTALASLQSAIENANKAIQTKLDTLSTEKVDNLQIGTRNFYHSKTVTENYDVANFSKTERGFQGIGNLQGAYPNATIRIRAIIAGGEWTVKFKAKSNANVPLHVDICDGTVNIFNLTTEYQWYEFTYNVSNFAETLYNFIDFVMPSYAWYYVDNLMVVQGNKAPVSWIEAPEDVQARIDAVNATAADAQAKANISKSITDKFGTTINGGLVSTVTTEYRELNSEQVTGLISGIQGANKNLPFLVAGGTYAEGIAGTAKAIIRHDGTSKFTDTEIEGIIKAISGEIAGFNIIGKSLISGTMQFTNSAIEPLSQLLTPSNVSITNQASWTSSVQNNSAHAYTQNFTLPNDGILKFEASAEHTGSYLQVGWAVHIEDANGSVVFSDMGDSSILSKPYQVNLESGTYSIHVQSYALAEAGQSFTNIASIFGESGSTTITIATFTNKTKIGNDGFFSFWGASNMLYYHATNGLTIRGTTDIPGVLAAGSSTSGGIQSNVWGAKSSTANITPITGGFRVPLSGLSHSNYVVQITPHTNTTFSVGTKTSTYFEVYGTGGFDYVVIGNNYA